MTVSSNSSKTKKKGENFLEKLVKILYVAYHCPRKPSVN